MSSKILITGSGGLLGSFVSVLLPQAVCLTRQDGDLQNPAAVKQLFEKYQPQAVLHLAAKVGGVKVNAEHNADFFTDNVLVNTHVLNAAREAGVKRVISLLSSCAYKSTADRDSSENDLHEGLPHEGNLGYGMSKRMLEIQSRLISKQYGFEYSTLTPVTMFGPHDHFDPETGHVVASLIYKCFAAKQGGSPMIVWGSGHAVRQFVYVKDVARLLCKWLQSGPYQDSVIMAPDGGMTIRELALQIAEAAGFKGEIIFDAAGPEGQRIRRLTSNKFQSCFPAFQFTSFKTAIQETVDWYAAADGRECKHV